MQPELNWGFKVRLENKSLRQRLDSFIAKFFTINIYLEFYDKKYNNLSRQCKVLGTDPKLDLFQKSLWYRMSHKTVKQVNNQNKYFWEFQIVVYFDKVFVIYQKLEIEDDF